ncbi:hypothetical protein DVA67_032855 [Solirubrobacter sp. CPCC 204708]|uniref:Uncharacterized protein n=1 Tax=Solirubrobacter deserti TaxID=2282478 RepID=A0ABT4RIQ9_9ACTN|nr:hypothetical protein [Solirubrobacter deserti]MBE2320796.1 hypothetical protein [Solirubrobacter deserti]MDA0138431.1 hypothetical protein [Solirubrobacter deserti]
MIGTSSALRQLAMLLALAFPGSAAAAPLGEVSYQDLAKGTGCLAPTGAPGELSCWAAGGAEVLVAGVDGVGAPVRVPFGRLPGCPRVAADASGAAVAAGATDRAVRVALREPGGGGFGAPVTLAAARDVFELSVAVSPRGDAVVAWAEMAYPPRRLRMRIARRPAGGVFGPPEDLVPWRSFGGSAGVAVGMAADGETVLMLREPRGSDSVQTLRIAPANAPFGPASPVPPGFSGLALGVAPDGRALVAASTGAGVAVLERPPGGAFGAPQVLTDPAGAINADLMAVGFGPGGRAVVAWHTEGQGTTGAATREALGAFGPPVVIVPAPADQSFGFGAGEPVVFPASPLHAAIAPDGRALVAWPDDGARIVTLSGTTIVERQRLGGTLRAADGLSLLMLPDGRRALAWTNHDRFRESGPARLHYAVEGRPAAAQRPAPRVTIGRPRERALRPGQPLVLPVRCSAACDLRVSIPGRGVQAVERSLTRAGTAIVRFRPFARAIAAPRAAPIRIVVRASAPGSQIVARATGRVSLTRVPALPFPRVTDVRARRISGGRVEVRWRMTGSATETLLSVEGMLTKGGEAVALNALWGGRRRSYRLVLDDAARVRWVTVRVRALTGRRTHKVIVPLR